MCSVAPVAQAAKASVDLRLPKNNFATQAARVETDPDRRDAQPQGDFVATGLGITAPDAIKNYISQRQSYILSQLATVPAPTPCTASNRCAPEFGGRGFHLR